MNMNIAVPILMSSFVSLGCTIYNAFIRQIYNNNKYCIFIYTLNNYIVRYHQDKVQFIYKAIQSDSHLH